MYQLRNPQLILADLSYRVIGVCFDAYNELGANRREKQYQQTIAAMLREQEIRFSEQTHCPVMTETKKIAAQFLDFLIEDKLVLELKVSNRFRKKDFDQANAYLATTELRLALLVRFDHTGVIVRRVVRL